MAAVDQRVDIDRITPDPVWRTSCGTLYPSDSRGHDLYKTWYKSGYTYYIDAPVEIAFPGGIQRQYIIGVRPVDKKTKVEIMSDCESNPNHRPWH